MVRTRPIERYQTLRDSAPCLSRVATPPEGHQIGARKRRVPGNITASLEGEPGPAPAGKSLPHSYPKKKVSEGEGHEVVKNAGL